jgi:putative ABC transport system substrate-binding protein
MQREASTIPIVFVAVSDPVGSGFVASLPRPGGNITGFINVEASIAGKWLELLKEIAPRTMRAGLMFNPSIGTYFDYYWKPFETAATAAAVTHPYISVRRRISSLSGRGGHRSNRSDQTRFMSTL